MIAIVVVMYGAGGARPNPAQEVLDVRRQLQAVIGEAGVTSSQLRTTSDGRRRQRVR